MKQCPRCQQTYVDELLNFCLNDGEMLVDFHTEPASPRFGDDSPPTLILDQARVTNPYQAPGPMVQQSPPQWQPAVSPQFGFAPAYVDDTMAKAAMILGIASVVLVCCYGGLWLGIPAIVTGFIGWRNAQEDPSRYKGAGMAVSGIAMGGVTLVVSLIFLLIAIIR
jgi:hypothetical protein